MFCTFQKVCHAFSTIFELALEYNFLGSCLIIAPSKEVVGRYYIPCGLNSLLSVWANSLIHILPAVTMNLFPACHTRDI